MNSLRHFILFFTLIFTSFIYNQEVQINFGSVNDNSAELTMTTPVDVGGFQFDVVGANLSGASGGLAQDAGFTVSTGGETVLGFSFTGSVIPAGSSGVLTNLSGNFSDDICLELGNGAIADPSGQAIDVSFGDADCDGNEPPCDDVDSDGVCDDVDDCIGYYDECNVCNGDGPSYECWDGSIVCDSSECSQELDYGAYIEFGSIDNNNMEILYTFLQDVAGFQFEVEGTQINGASGGSASDFGFTVSAGGNTVLGFSFTGSVIPVGSGLLTNLDYTATASEGCLSGLVFSDTSGNAIDSEAGDCVALDFEEPIFGCTDSDACNYDADANVDDGSCFFETECWDGTSECDPTDCPEPPSETVYLGFGSVGDTTMEIAFESYTPVAGFQFDVEGTQLYAAGGGLAGQAGFTVSVGGNTVIGFSLQGATVQGEGILTNLEYAALASDAPILRIFLASLNE